MNMQVYAVGLLPKEFHTLEVLLPTKFQITQTTANDFLDHIDRIIGTCACVVINPKKLEDGQLAYLLEKWRDCLSTCHAPMLLVAAQPTKGQMACEIADQHGIVCVDLMSRFDVPLRNAIRILIAAHSPCAGYQDWIAPFMFNDGWYLLDVETDGLDPLCDNIIAISLAYMANYEVLHEETLYIRQEKPIAHGIEVLTGITNEVLANGITLKQAVETLDNLPHPAPLVLAVEDFQVSFLKNAWHMCDKRFAKAYIGLDGLAALTFPQSLSRTMDSLLALVSIRRYKRTHVDNPCLAQLYDLTLAVFEALQKRYDVRCPGHFDKLYETVGLVKD